MNEPARLIGINFSEIPALNPLVPGRGQAMFF